jgi:hypothetical protein
MTTRRTVGCSTLELFHGQRDPGGNGLLD